MSIKDDYYIQEVNFTTAESVVVKCHYAHRHAPYTHAYGLFSRDLKRLVGVVIYGSPASKFLCESLCGFDERYNIYELTRLYIDDGLPRNLESYLVGNTLKLLDKEIIVSYSDTEFNHVGIIYQATNFYYTGLTKPSSLDFEGIDESGNRLHNKSLYDKYGSTEAIKQAIEDGENIYVVKRSQKHRYVYFNCNKRRKKELLAKLKERYEILPYPKQNCPCPITSTVNISDGVSNQRKLFSL